MLTIVTAVARGTQKLDQKENMRGYIPELPSDELPPLKSNSNGQVYII